MCIRCNNICNAQPWGSRDARHSEGNGLAHSLEFLLYSDPAQILEEGSEIFSLEPDLILISLAVLTHGIRMDGLDHGQQIGMSRSILNETPSAEYKNHLQRLGRNSDSKHDFHAQLESVLSKFGYENKSGKYLLYRAEAIALSNGDVELGIVVDIMDEDARARLPASFSNARLTLTPASGTSEDSRIRYSVSAATMY